MSVKLNSKGVEKAHSLIASGKVDKTSGWSFSAADGTAAMSMPGCDPGCMFLGRDMEADPTTKAAWHYPYGKGGKVYRSALIAIRSRAAQQDAKDIFDAAGRMLNKIDGTGKAADTPFEIKRKDVQCEFECKDADRGTFAGYAAMFGNVDQGGDIIHRGAFEQVDQTKDGQVRVLYQHDMRQPIGKARVKQDDHGLHFDGTLALGVSKARDAYELMKANILDGMSIGYDVLPDGSNTSEAGIRNLTRLKLWEISPVTFGMNPLARVEGVKTIATIKTRREFEDYLREAGFSSNQAKQIALFGWKEEAPESYLRDADEEVKSVVARINAFEIGSSHSIKSALDAIESLKV